MRVLQRITTLSILLPFLFVFTTGLSLVLAVVAYQVQDLSLRTWDVRVEWGELDVLTNDVMFFRLDSQNRLDELVARWALQSVKMDEAFTRLITHPRITLLPEEVRDEIVRASYIWRFSKARLDDSYRILGTELREPTFLPSLFATGEASLYDALRVMRSMDPPEPRRRRFSYTRIMANINTLNYTTSELSSIMKEVQGKIPPVLNRYAMIAVALIIGGFAVVSAYTALQLGRLSAPIRRLAERVRKIGESDAALHGDHDQKSEPTDEVELIDHGIRRLVARVGELYQRSIDNERRLHDAEVRALQYQINPHFLYNTLGMLQMSASAVGQHELAGDLRSLSRLLRAIVRRANRFVTLAEELETAEDYLSIIQTRYNKSLKVSIDASTEALTARIPGQIIQPVLENAVIHGLSARLNAENGGAMIVIRSTVVRDVLTIEVIDNGEGIDEQRCASLLDPSRSPPLTER